MRIGLDIDDTICNTYDLVLKYVCKYYNLNYKEYKNKKISYDYFKKNLESFQIYAKNNYKYIIPNSPLKKGVIKYITKLKKRGHEIIFITGRDYDEFDDPYNITYNFLIKNKVPFDKLLTSRLNKGEACLEEKIDIYFDDEFKNYESVKKVGIEVYLFSKRANKYIKNVRRVDNFRNIYKIIKNKEKNKD